jgi:hypothetical protein
VKNLPRDFLVFIAVMLAVSVFLIWTGLERQDSTGTLAAIAGAVALLSMVGLIGAIIVRSRRNIIPADDPRPPAWLDTWRDSRGNVLVFVLGTAFWGYHLVTAVTRGAYGPAALDALLFIGTVWGLMRVLRRRRKGRI